METITITVAIRYLDCELAQLDIDYNLNKLGIDYIMQNCYVLLDECEYTYKFKNKADKVLADLTVFNNYKKVYNADS